MTLLAPTLSRRAVNLSDVGKAVNRLSPNGSERGPVISLSCAQDLHQHCSVTILRCVCRCHTPSQLYGGRD